MPSANRNPLFADSPDALKQVLEREQSLPSLPVPSLEATFEKLKLSLRPLLNDEDYKKLEQKVDDFRKSPVSLALQNHLTKLYQNEECYLDHLNLDHILIDHKALPRNPFLILEDDPLRTYANPQNQVQRASVLTISALKFVASLRSGDLAIDESRSGKSLTIRPYFSLFGTTRYPADNDSIRTKHYNNSDYILVMANSQFYTLKVLNENNELIFNSDELSALLNGIVKEADSVPNPNLNSLGPITADSYRHWKSARTWLQQEFKENMNRIDQALFVLVLDKSSPAIDDNEEVTQAISVGTLHIDEYGIQRGSCNSRWYDKLQLVVTKNSIAGVVWDSLSQDGTSVLRFTSDIYADSVLRLADGNHSLFPKVKYSTDTSLIKPTPEKISWQFEADTFTFLHLSETRLADLMCSHSIDTKVLKYGRKFARKIGVKADSLIQVTLQIAQYALYGKPISTVEPVSTRTFRNSRSELVPLQNDTITKACQIFVSEAPSLLRWQTFIDTCKFHSNTLRNASNGGGFEKHLKALQNIYLQRDVFNQLSPEFRIDDGVPPLIFDDIISPLFVPELIASNCGNPAMRLFGLTPAVPNGFGIGYIIKEDKTEFCAISQYRQGDRLLSTMEWVLHQLQHIWRHEVGVKRIPHAHALDNMKDVGTKNKDTLSDTRMSRSSTIASSEDDVEVTLGGYGYFDIDDLTGRSSQTSLVNTPLLSARNSSSELVRLIERPNLDRNFGKRLSRADNLKDRFEKHDSNETKNSSADKSLNNRFDAKFDRAAVGKKVSVDEVLS